MNVLHINTNYTNNRVHENLVNKISENTDIDQIIYCPLRKGVVFQNTNSVAPGNILIIRECYNYFDRLTYYSKIWKIFRSIRSDIRLNTIDIVHAHTLYSDGAVAYEIFKQYGKPYIISIRNTDISKFQKYRKDLKGYGRDILQNAFMVIVINKKYKDIIIDHYGIERGKIISIPNGLGEFWHKNRHSDCQTPGSGKINLLYVGELIKRKNVGELINIIKSGLLHTNCSLTIVGSKGHYYKQVIEASDGEIIKYEGEVKDQNSLLQHYRNTDVFIMPSRNETFGMVYLEALSQGKPIIYLRDEGIGSFVGQGKVGYALKELNLYELDNALEYIIENYSVLSRRAFDISTRFELTKIAKDFTDLYSAAILS